MSVDIVKADDMATIQKLKMLLDDECKEMVRSRQAWSDAKANTLKVAAPKREKLDRIKKMKKGRKSLGEQDKLMDELILLGKKVADLYVEYREVAKNYLAQKYIFDDYIKHIVGVPECYLHNCKVSQPQSTEPPSDMPPINIYFSDYNGEPVGLDHSHYILHNNGEVHRIERAKQKCECSSAQ